MYRLLSWVTTMKTNLYESRPNDRTPVALVCPSFEAFGAVRHGFSTRLGGNSTGALSSLNLGLHTEDERKTVLQNYTVFCDAVGVDREKLILPHQVHSAEVKIVTKTDAGKGLVRESDLGDFDALVTAEKGLPIGVFYADCTPLLLFDPTQRVIAAVHSGWRGTLARIGRKTVQIMRRNFGCQPENILAAFGPSIKQCHFEIGGDVFADFCQSFGARKLYGSLKKGEKYYVDTDRLNIGQLLEEGLREENISHCDICTVCRRDTFFSHRGDGGKTGRMCAVIELL